jgi:hypothetical protein
MECSHHSLSAAESVAAGDFSDWLGRFRASLSGNGGVEVDCGECFGCCRSSYFIHLRPEDRDAARKIPAEVLFPAPGQPKGHFLMGYDQAVRDAARFMQRYSRYFPDGRVPDNPSQLAALAIKAYRLFVGLDLERVGKNACACSELADKVVAACRQFDAAMQ